MSKKNKVQVYKSDAEGPTGELLQELAKSLTAKSNRGEPLTSWERAMCRRALLEADKRTIGFLYGLMLAPWMNDKFSESDLDRMEDAGLIEFGGAFVGLTAEGRALVEAHRPELEKAAAEWAQDWD